MVIDADAHSRNASDAILAKLHFAVAPMDSLDKALEVMAALRPDIIVTPASDAVRVRARLQADDENGAVPLVVVTDGVPEPEALVEDIRRALRAKRES
jgi:two-component SAPR family response regulator